MSRTISAAMKAHLTQPVVQLSYCCKVTRRDNTVFGFTSDNLSFTFEGVHYEGAAAASASAIRASQGTGVDNLDVIGLLDSDQITDTDLYAGKYDNAQVEVFIVNPADLSMGKVILLSGNIGQIDFQDGTYTAEVRGLFQKLGVQVGELTSPTCRVAQLGDSRCKIDLAPFSFTQQITGVVDDVTFTFPDDGRPANYYAYGIVEARSGQNVMERRDIKSSSRNNAAVTIVLQLPFAFPLAVGDTIVVQAGCDRLFTTCRDKFSNLINFRGEPYVPGTTALLTPGRP